ncbi:MAG: FprA family A-type flavoprotein [Duncaniella sp.]|nr:FprA family A-type flavoprotein [Duncaniella sp.]MDE5733988.1 FprA family A-type flavoprotein [Duncaniella sp.]
MDVNSISERIYYIGVNDRTTARFEGMWPLPCGVSYNSYLVCGPDKAAIVDGVEAAHAGLQIAEIKARLGDRKPDYLIINHMEPDHSGAIRALRAEWPGLTVVGNAQTLAMVKGFYDVEGPELRVKDGDTLSLGQGCTLRFCLTPMVHWPETMMTLLEEEETLFSGDAFGCFGALNGYVTDEECGTEAYFDEMVRYYSSIVGKYGPFVQKAIAKLSGTSISTICPTHGPVWRRQIARVIDIYDRLSRYEPLDNGCTVVYGSMYGNTALMAEEAARELAGAGVRPIEVFDASHTDLSFLLAAAFRHKGLVIASPTYSETIFPPVKCFVDALVTRRLTGREMLLAGGCSWAERASGLMRELLGKEIPAIPFKHAGSRAEHESIRLMARELAGRLL